MSFLPASKDASIVLFPAGNKKFLCVISRVETPWRSIAGFVCWNQVVALPQPLPAMLLRRWNGSGASGHSLENMNNRLY